MWLNVGIRHAHLRHAQTLVPANTQGNKEMLLGRLARTEGGGSRTSGLRSRARGVIVKLKKKRTNPLKSALGSRGLSVA